MKLAVALCVALLPIVLVQAEDEMLQPIRRARTRFIPGILAKPSQFPFVAYIRSEGRKEHEIRNCAGALINRVAVLTEAWCTHGYTKFTVRLGSVHSTENDINAWTDVSLWAVDHPDYNENTIYSNLGIIYLTIKAPVNNYIKPVNLPSSPHVGSFVCCGGIAISWDLGQLRWGEMTVIPNEVCEKFFEKSHVTDRSICVGNRYSINHRLGTLLVIKNKGRYMLAGVYSEGWRHFNTSKPYLYTRVSSMIEWIKLKTESNAAKNDRRRQSSPHPDPVAVPVRGQQRHPVEDPIEE